MLFYQLFHLEYVVIDPFLQNIVEPYILAILNTKLILKLILLHVLFPHNMHIMHLSLLQLFLQQHNHEYCKQIVFFSQFLEVLFLVPLFLLDYQLFHNK